MKKVKYIIVFILLSSQAFSQRDMFYPNLLPYSTIRIEGFSDTIMDGKKFRASSVGTGFFFEFKVDTFHFMAIVSNRHVVENSTTGILEFKTIDTAYHFGKNLQSDTVIIKNFNRQWIYHPTEDLAILILDEYKERIENKTKKRLATTYLNKELIPTLTDSMQISSLEKVVMVGYPLGVFDKRNNLPVIRQGITATPYFSDFNGAKRFLVDIPTFHGSSGSPVFLYSYDPYWIDTTMLRGGEFRIFFLGIAVESYTYDAKGKIKLNNQTNISNTDSIEKNYTSSVEMPLNLAIVIKAERLEEFVPLLRQRLSMIQKIRS